MKFSGRTVVAVIEFPRNKILLVKRGTVVFKGYWALPGGRVDAGETVEQAIVREVEEETGLEVRIVSKIGEYRETGVQDGIEYDYFPACFLASPFGGEIKRQVNEIEKIELFNPGDLPPKLAFEHANMIRDYLRIREISRLSEDIRKCKKCRLHKTRINAVPGEGPATSKILVCGQAPGRKEDQEGRPFVGSSGRLLNQLLRSIGLDRERIFLTSPIKCFPPNNRLPKSDELKTCSPYLKKQIETIKPVLIITLGNCGLQTLLGRENKISLFHGIKQEKDGVCIFPTFHPSAARRFPKIKALMKNDFNRLQDLLVEKGLI